MPASTALTERSIEVLRTFPGWAQDDPNIVAIAHVWAMEGQRMEDAADAITANAIPVTVTELGAAWHEKNLRLPVNPSGTTISQRVERIVAGYRSRTNVSGLSWQADVTDLVGGPGWHYTEDSDDFLMTVYVPFGGSTEQFLRLQKQIPLLGSWPCHLTLSLQSEAGFILDQSQLDNQQFHP